MGTSIQIKFIDDHAIEGEEPPSIYFYAHWDGDEVLARLRASFLNAKDRWDDPPYLARFVFDKMKGDDVGLTGFGISSYSCSSRTLIIDATAKRVIAGVHSWSFEEFATEPITELYWKCGRDI
jgi:hypothetical protein